MKNNNATQLEQGPKVKMPTAAGSFYLIPFRQADNGLEHMALLKGDISREDSVLTRIHSACATGDIFGSKRCDCGEQLERAMQLIEENGSGLVIYLQQEGRGIGLMNKIHAYKLQEEGFDTVDANVSLGFAPDERDYSVAVDILKALSVSRVRLLTNNPLKVQGLEDNEITVSERMAIIVSPGFYNRKYLETKAKRMGHILEES